MVALITVALVRFVADEEGGGVGGGGFDLLLGATVLLIVGVVAWALVRKRDERLARRRRGEPLVVSTPEGQYEVPPEELDGVSRLHQALIGTVHISDREEATRDLNSLIDEIQRVGRRLPDDPGRKPHLVLPGRDARLDEIRGVVGDEELLPG